MSFVIGFRSLPESQQPGHHAKARQRWQADWWDLCFLWGKVYYKSGNAMIRDNWAMFFSGGSFSWLCRWQPDSYDSKGMAARAGLDAGWAQQMASRSYLGELLAQNQGPSGPCSWDTDPLPASHCMLKHCAGSQAGSLWLSRQAEDGGRRSPRAGEHHLSGVCIIPQPKAGL